MVCRICGKHYEGHACPICAFPLVHLPYREVRSSEALHHIEEQYRGALLRHLSLSLTVHYWKENGDRLVPDRAEDLSFGTGAEMLNAEAWLPGAFARTQERVMRLRLKVLLNGVAYEREVPICNLIEKSPRRLGATLDERLRVKLTLRGSSGAEICSDWLPLFD